MLHGDLLGERARLTPDKTALVVAATGARLTYLELDRRARRCARALRERLALRRGDRLAVLAENRLEFLDAFFAAGKSGVTLVPLGTRLTAHELRHIVEDSGARALIYSGALEERVRELGEIIELEHWVALDAPAAPGHRRYGLLLEEGREGRADTAAPPQPVEPASREGDGGVQAADATLPCGPEEIYCLVYTSGTTGKPKGVMIPHRMVAWNGYATVAGWQLREDDVSPIFTPLYHAGGLGAFLTPMIAVGGTVVLHTGFDTAEVLRTIEEERCTVVLGVPTIFQLLLEAPELARTDLSTVRWLISGGAPMPTDLVQAYRRRGLVLRQGYGLSEVGVNCFAMSSREAWEKVGSIGKPMLHTEARLLDGDGVEVPAGEVGELLLRGPHVSRGYWHDPAATAEAYDRGGWFHTGDLARRDEEGFYYIAGRRKEMFISGGVNVYPGEIEVELLRHPQVQDAAVVGVDHPRWGEVGVGFVVPRPGESPDEQELAGYLGKRLASFKIPRAFRIVEELPRTSYGKVVRGQLREAYLAAR
jgi:fatty-acyl-CoA synthase